MPFIMDNKIYPVAWHGGAKDLDKIDRLLIELTLHFPYTGDAGNYTLTPVTLNLSNDLGIEPTNQVYAVKWGEAGNEATDTVSQADNPVKHVHTYLGGSGQTTNVKTFQIEVYGYNLTKYYPIDTQVGTGNTGYRIITREVSLYVRSKGY